MREVETGRFEGMKKYFSEFNPNPVLSGVLEGHNPGSVFISDQPPFYSIIRAKNEQVYFFGGTPPKSPSEIFTLFEEHIFSEALKNGEEYFQTFFAEKRWKEFYSDNFSAYMPFTVKKNVLTANKHKVYRNHAWRGSIPEGIEVGLIDETTFNEIDDGEGMNFSKWWYDYESFRKNGLGTCVYIDGKAVSCCFSCFFGSGTYEIGAVTSPQFRKRGFCTLAANLFIEKSFSKGIQPRWTCSEKNQASVKTALNSGFEIADSIDYKVFSIIECNRYFDAAWFRYLEKNLPASVQNLEKGLEIKKPSSKEFHIFCARIYAAAGITTKAKTHLKLLLDRNELERADILGGEFSESGLTDFFFPKDFSV